MHETSRDVGSRLFARCQVLLYCPRANHMAAPTRASACGEGFRPNGPCPWPCQATQVLPSTHPQTLLRCGKSITSGSVHSVSRTSARNARLHVVPSGYYPDEGGCDPC